MSSIKRMLVFILLIILLTITGISSAQVPEWRAWVLMPGGQWLMLIDDSGQQFQVFRPLLPGESAPNTDADMVISRDGRYLLIDTTLDSGDQALGIYDLGSRILINTIVAQSNEEIDFGWQYGDGQGISGSSLIFSPDSQKAVVSFADDSTGEWRLFLIDMPSGAIDTQIANFDLPVILTTSNTNLIEAANQTYGNFFPRPLYWDNNNGVHIQLILAQAGGGESYPTFVWYPAQNRAEGSPYVRSSIDIYWQNGLALTPYWDTTVASLPATGPFNPNNSIATGTPMGDVLILDPIYRNSNFYHFSSYWMDAGRQIVFLTNDSLFNEQWAIYDPLGNEPAQFLPTQYQYPHPVGEGVLAVSEAVEGFEITYIRGVADTRVIWNAPPMVGRPVVLWAQMPGCGFGLEGSGECVVQTGDGGGGIVGIDLPTHCPSAPPSINAVNTEARVTFTDGRPLNVRITPGGTILAIQEEGETFTIIDGPECQGNFTWWRIQLRNSAQGWVAEGDFDDYYIEPLP